MKAKIMLCLIVLVLSAFTGVVYGGDERSCGTFYGQDAGHEHDPTNCPYNSYFGYSAGYANPTSAVKGVF